MSLLIELLRESVVDQMVEAGELNPKDKESIKKAPKKLKQTPEFRKASELKIIRFINRYCGSSRYVGSTRPR